MTMKKILYHGSFATLGVSLLLGMAVLQANGRKSPEDLMNTADTVSSEEMPVNDGAGTITASAPKPSPALAQVRKEIPDSRLASAHAISIFDSANKAATKKTFGSTAQGIRQAQSYYETLAKNPNRSIMIKAEMKKGQWQVVSAGDFKTYAESVSSR